MLFSKKSFVQLFSLLIIIGSLSSCFNYEEVEIKDIKSIKLLEFSDKGLVVESVIQIYNPNSYDLNVVDSEFEVSVKNSLIGNAFIDSKVEIPANSEDYHTVVLKSNYKDLAPGALATLMTITAMGGDDIYFKVDGFIIGKAYFIKKKVHVSHEGKVPLKLF